MKSRLHVFAALAVAATITFVIASAVDAASNPGNGKPHAVVTASDSGKSKLDSKLQDALESGSTETVPVFVTATDGVSAVESLLTNAHAATRAGNSLVVGKINVQQLPKLGGIDGVVSVGLLEFKQTGQPLGVDPEINKTPSLSTLQSTVNTLRKQEVSYANAPALKGSNFEALKNLNVLDAKTHRFSDAWKAGFDGTGTTGSVLDGGTDWGHPDLIGTWKTWGASAPDPGWAGWPMAFDPYGTLILLAAPDMVDQGLSWYSSTEEKTSFGSVASNPSLATVTFATRTGPARNFSAPDGTNTHAYSFPKSWAAGGKVWLGSHPDDHLLQLFQERPAFLLVDSNNDGQGDTIYVDLDDDYQFGDEKPVTKSSPVSFRDMNGDGYVDLSGGLAYFIADGATSLPGGTELFLDDPLVPDANSFVAWSGDFDPAIEGHGTLTASNVVGQGVINGKAPTFSDLPGNGKYPGAVIGGAPKAKLAPMGDIYFSFTFSTQLGYYLTAGYGVDVTSNSYGSSNLDNDGYDAASQEAGFLNGALNGGRTTPVFSTGNGAPGYGTATAPRPFNGITVGASTQFGGTGWDSVAKLANIPDNDITIWSNRGPGAPGSTAVDVVADGSYSPGDATLNTVLDGRNAWETWGGTSRSTPVTVGATLLAYQAFEQANAGTKPTNTAARRIIKSSAQDLRYDAWTQGAGSVDAKRATEIATSGGTVSPDAWRAGSYRGAQYPTFTNLVAPGGTSTRTFSVTGTGTYNVSDRYLVRSAKVTKTFTSSNVNKESTYNFNAPDYLMNISSEVRAHPDADLMVVRANFPYEKFDGNGDYTPDQKWRLYTYKWNDVNGDGKLWSDRDADGVVDHNDTATSSNIDGFNDINFASSEVEKGEYVRFQYHRPDANTLISFVRQPAQRMADGLFIGFQHNVRNNAIPTTSFDIEIDFYKQVDWPWLSTPATVTAPGSFAATLNVPADAAYGMYEGAIVLNKDGRDQIVPVSATVGGTLPQDTAGNVTGTLEFGGASVAAAQSGFEYNNGAVFGATDWSWRAESGDWRFFYYDALKAPPTGTLLLADTSWADGVPTDIDTLLFGRSANSYQLVGGSGSLVGDPYILGTVGKSPNTNTGAGVWKYNTATGGSRDIVSGPAQEGLGAVAWHQVNFSGDKFFTPVKTTLGAAQVTPSTVAQTTAADTGSFDVTFKANVDLTGLQAEAFGLSQPTTENVQVKQDDPDDPSTASVKRNIALHHASKLQVNFDLNTDDNDLFVLRDANGDGQFTSNEIVASSTTSSSHEAVTLVKPADGNYQVWVQGFSVSGTPTGTLKLDAIQGDDLTVTGLPSGAVPAGTTVSLHVAYNKAMTAGQYFGELLLGPNEAPAALKVPVAITRN